MRSLTAAALFLAALSAPGQEPPAAVLKADAFWRQARGAFAVLSSSILVPGDFNGPIKAASVRFRFLEALDVSAALSRKAGEWRFTSIEGRLAGGAVTGAVSVSAPQDAPLDINLELFFDNVALADLCIMAGCAPYTGKVKGRLRLRLSGPADTGLSGEGSFYVYDADLARVPTLVKVVGLLGAPSIRGTRFTSGEAHFTLTPKRAVFQSIDVFAEVGSVTLSARRNSAIAYDGTLDFVVEPVIGARFLAGLKLAGEFASTVLKAVEGRVARIRIGGTISDPQVAWSPQR